MTDIAEEMRGLANEPIVTGPEGRALLRKGANEIERLRSALQEFMGHWEKIPMWNAREVNASVERAREALSLPPSERGSP